MFVAVTISERCDCCTSSICSCALVCSMRDWIKASCIAARSEDDAAAAAAADVEAGAEVEVDAEEVAGAEEVADDANGVESRGARPG